MQLKQLPPDAVRLCAELRAPPRLVIHLTLVHDAAVKLCDGIEHTWPNVTIEKVAVLLGAATHDLGKILVLNELTGPGNRHAEVGPALLEKHGIAPEIARFARSHATWQSSPDLALEDLLVALADNIWKGTRYEPLEDRISGIIANQSALDRWQVFMALDEILQGIAEGATERLLQQDRG